MRAATVVIKIDEDIELKQLEQSDTNDIFCIIDKQRKYLGRWLPFVELTKDISDTDQFVKDLDSNLRGLNDMENYLMEMFSLIWKFTVN
jgi:hypothetical protein